MKSRNRQSLRGLSLVASMWIIIALTGLVLSMSYSVRLEAIASANRYAVAQAEAAARGAEKYLLMAVDQELYSWGTMKDLNFEARQIGDCYVWFINNTPGESTFTFGPTDEGGKFNLNLMSVQNSTDKNTFYKMLKGLPDMTDIQASCIIDWRDSDDTAYDTNGAEDSYYSTQKPAYYTKDGDFESTDELMLVKGFDFKSLYGGDTNRNGIIDEGETAESGSESHGVGLAPYVTTFGVATQVRTTSNGPGGAPVSTTSTVYKINLNTASMEVLKALFSYAGDETSAETAAKNLIAHRKETTTSDPTEIVKWLYQNNRSMFTGVSKYINNVTTVGQAPNSSTTPPTLVYSADILAVTRDGRAFKRYRVVAQGSQSSSNVTKIIFRQDMTAAGWPLDPQIRTDLRNGIEPSTGSSSK